jgi:hypothetical protein
VVERHRLNTGKSERHSGGQRIQPETVFETHVDRVWKSGRVDNHRGRQHDGREGQHSRKHKDWLRLKYFLVDFSGPTLFGLEQTYKYFAYGLILSSNAPIAGLVATNSTTKTPNLRINFGTLPTVSCSDDQIRLRYASAYLGEHGEPALRIWDINDGAFLRINYSDGTEFWLDRELGTLWAQWPEKCSLADTLSYLLGPVLGLVLRLRGVICLHASAVSIDDRSAVFVGSEGSGKSTTAAAFAREGFAVLSDDIVGLVEQGNEFQVFPAYPRVNLWPDSVKLLYGSADALPPLSAGWDKRALTLGEAGGPRFEERQLRLGTIYIFGDISADATENIEAISQKTALMTLVGNTYAATFLDAKQRAEEFAVLSRLVAAVPVRRINPRRNVTGVNELCELIRQDFVA